MNKKELINAIAEQAELSKKDAAKAVEAFVEVVTNSLKEDAEKVIAAYTDVVTEELVNGGKVQLIGFGTFEVRERAAREGHNPHTGAKIQIPAAKVPAFKAGKALKDAIAE